RVGAKARWFVVVRALGKGALFYDQRLEPLQQFLLLLVGKPGTDFAGVAQGVSLIHAQQQRAEGLRAAVVARIAADDDFLSLFDLDLQPVFGSVAGVVAA